MAHIPPPLKRRLEVEGKTNLDLMKEGLAPIGDDGKPLILHYIFSDNNSPLIEIEDSEYWHHYGAQHHSFITMLHSSIDNLVDTLILALCANLRMWPRFLELQLFEVVHLP